MEEVARVILALEEHDVAEEVMHFLDRTGRARVVATASDEHQLSEAIRQLEPDAVVGSPRLASSARLNGSALFAVDTTETVQTLRRALKAGARGFFLWPADRGELARAVARVFAPDPGSVTRWDGSSPSMDHAGGLGRRSSPPTSRRASHGGSCGASWWTSIWRSPTSDLPWGLPWTDRRGPSPTPFPWGRSSPPATSTTFCGRIPMGSGCCWDRPTYRWRSGSRLGTSVRSWRQYGRPPTSRWCTSTVAWTTR
jgi:hypothetical protein